MRSGQSTKAALHRNWNGMRPVACAQFADHVLHVALYCFFGDREAVPDSFVRFAPGYKLQDLDFTFGQIVDFKTLSQTFGDRICEVGFKQVDAEIKFSNRARRCSDIKCSKIGADNRKMQSA